MASQSREEVKEMVRAWRAAMAAVKGGEGVDMVGWGGGGVAWREEGGPVVGGAGLFRHHIFGRGRSRVRPRSVRHARRD